MNKNVIKKYAIWARRELIERVSQRAVIYGITPKDVGNPDADSVNGYLLSQTEKKQRQALIRIIGEKGFTQVMEEVAYTWFNRFAALRFMEVNGYLPSHVRVFTNDAGEFKPQILAEAIHLELDGLDMKKVYALENENKSEELFKYLLIVQCNALNSILPGMFQKIDDYTELLLPDYLLREGSVIEQMVTTIPEEDWTDQVQIIGWLYQYYNTEPKDKVFADLKKNIKITKENIPAATQLFTPDWIVHYMVENSLGRLWIERKLVDSSELVVGSSEYEEKRQQIEKALAEKFGWKYYLTEAKQEPEVRQKLTTIHYPLSTTPQELRVIDPCCGSGHILCVLFDILVQIYEDYGHTAREAAVQIVENNLWGLDIDERAAQLSYFAVMMKARQYDRRFFSRNVQPHVYSPKGYPEGLEYGSLITVDALEPAPEPSNRGLFDEKYSLALNRWYFRHALSQKYHVVVTNPPYMGASNMSSTLSDFIKKNYSDYKSDFFSAFMIRCSNMTMLDGYCGFFTPYVWMFIQSYENLRNYLYGNCAIETLIQFEYSAFEEATVPVCTLVFKNVHIHGKKGCYCRLTDFRGGMEVQRIKTLEAINNHKCGFYYEQTTDNFSKIPGSPVAYWVGKGFCDAFDNKTLYDFAPTKQGLITSDNNKFLRLWFEVQSEKSLLNIKGTCKNDMNQDRLKWFPYSKGGNYRKWYGNRDYVVNWQYNGVEIKNFKDDRGKIRSRPQNVDYYFKEGNTWSDITSGLFSARYIEGGFIHDSTGPMCFPINRELTYYLLAVLNCKPSAEFLMFLAPTFHFREGPVGLLPVKIENKDGVDSLVSENIVLSRTDWDSFETSWDFARHPLLPKRQSSHNQGEK